MIIFIDDWRKPHDKGFDDKDCILCKSYQDFDKTLSALLDEQKMPYLVSFDYDLGDWNYHGTDCFKLLIRTCIKYGLPMPTINVHSEYPGIKKDFKILAESYERHTDNKVKYF